MLNSKVYKDRQPYILMNYQEKRMELINAFGGKCSICGNSDNLHFHHIRETKLHGVGRGSWERYYDIKHNPNSYQLVCKKCHKKIHYGK